MPPVDELSFKPDPNCERLVKVLFRRGEPDRVPFFELFFDKPMKDHLLGKPCSYNLILPVDDYDKLILNDIELNYRLGFDYISLIPLFIFGNSFVMADDVAPLKNPTRFWLKEDTGALIPSRAQFESHLWPDPNTVDLKLMEFAAANLPDGMGLIVQLPGIVENVTWLMGYENLGVALVDNPEFVGMMFDKVGSSVLRLAERAIGLPKVIAINHGDDMGHKTSTLLSPATMRKYAFAWHKKIAEACHRKNIAYVLHSCGQVEKIMPDFIDDIGIDGKHSFEDIIEPVESIKRKWGDKISILGGVDVDLLSRGTTQQVVKRTREIIEACAPGGGYALGTGNSVTNYIKPENYIAMIETGIKSGKYPIEKSS